MRFAGLDTADTTNFDTDATSGKKTLKGAAVLKLQNSIQIAVQANACSTCTVKVTSVVEDATGNVLFSASSRRLAASGGVTVTFATSGGTSAQLAAVTTASTSTAFTTAVTTAVASNPGFAGVTASAVAAAPEKAGPPLGLLGLLALLVLVPIAYYCLCIKKKPTDAAKAAPAALVINAPPGATVIITGSGNGAAV